jgi:hypothetical protein
LRSSADVRRGLIGAALEARLGTVNDLRVVAERQFGSGESVTAVEARSGPPAFSAPIGAWVVCDVAFSDSLRAISTGASVAIRRVADPPTSISSSPLDNRSIEARLECPANVSHGAARALRESLLRKLMTRDRQSVGPEALASPDVMLRLNLVTIHAYRTGELRYLDAANALFERLVPALTEGPSSASACFLGTYARALAAWLHGATA